MRIGTSGWGSRSAASELSISGTSPIGDGYTGRA